MKKLFSITTILALVLWSTCSFSAPLTGDGPQGGGGSMTYPGAGVAVSTGSAWDTSLSTDGSGDCASGKVCLGDHTHSGYSTTTVATDTIFDAAGDIVQGTGANTSARLPIGTAGQMLKVNSGGTALEYTSTVSISAVDMSAGTLNMTTGTADVGASAGRIAHDNNDTAANSGGAFEWYDGAQIRTVVDTGTNYTIITKTEFLPIAWAVDGATAPSALAAVTGKEINARSFTEGDDVVFWWIVPNDYVGGVKYRVHYALSANASADETVVYSMTGCIIANSGDPDGSAGTALTISDELGTDDDQYQYMVTDYSAESNADWSLAAGALARLAFSNAAAGDLTSGEPLVIGIEIKYKAKIIGFGGY